MKEVITISVSVVVILCTAISCGTYYNIKKDEAMKSNIESAIVKGIDPLAVRCAYDATGTVCSIYAAKK